MADLVFTVDDTFKEIVEHATNAPEMRKYYGKTIKPSLLLVKDAGCYLMSAGSPGLKVDPTDTSQYARQVVKYAEGLGEDADWDLVRSVCGGDDFSEPLPLEWFTPIIERGVGKFILRMTANQIKLVFA